MSQVSKKCADWDRCANANTVWCTPKCIRHFDHEEDEDMFEDKEESDW